MNSKCDNLNIIGIDPLLPPFELRKLYPSSGGSEERIIKNRNEIEEIIDRKSGKFIIIAGPCSIHSPIEAIEYAEKLKTLSKCVDDKLKLIMRVYFEKPRTTVGWKGLIFDPFLDGSDDMETGLKTARKLLTDIDSMGLPVGTEILDTVTAQYIADLISWASIGARTTESQTHRQLASGLSMPVGFKNATNGNINTAVEAIKTAIHKHSFIGILEDGRTGICHTSGNKYAHIVLRGGALGQNYTSEHIAYAKELMKRSELTPSIIVDCSHSNSEKKAINQQKAVDDIMLQKINGETSIIGLMLESNLHFGSQKLIHKNDFPHFRWQRSFYDYIIRGEQSLHDIRQYIWDNPARWESDRNNPINLCP